MNLEKLADIIKVRIPFDFPSIEYKLSITDTPNVLSGHTRIEKKENVKVTITLHITRSLLARPNIKNAIKMVLAHELCHVVKPFNPDKVMGEFLPEMWIVWEKCEKARALKCDAQIKEIK